MLHYNNGALTSERAIAPGGGFRFQPRNLDFHPSKPWVYVAFETQNTLQMYDRGADGALANVARFAVSTLDAPLPLQTAGAVAVHPNGRTVYVANRASATGLNSIEANLRARSCGATCWWSRTNSRVRDYRPASLSSASALTDASPSHESTTWTPRRSRRSCGSESLASLHPETPREGLSDVRFIQRRCHGATETMPD